MYLSWTAGGIWNAISGRRRLWKRRHGEVLQEGACSKSTLFPWDWRAWENFHHIYWDEWHFGGRVDVFAWWEHKMIQGKEGSDHDGPWMVSVGNRTMALKDIHVLILGTCGWVKWHGKGELTDGIRGTNRLTLRWRHYPELSRWAPWNHTFLWVEERSRKIERTREMAVWGRPSLMLLVLKLEKGEASQGMEWPLEDGRNIDRWVELGVSGEVQPDPSSSGVWVNTSEGLLPRGQGPGLFCSGISQSLNTACPQEWRRHSQASLD